MAIETIRTATVYSENETNLVLALFLTLLAHDIAHRPEALSPALAPRIAALTADVIIDPDSPIAGNVAL